MCRVRCEIRDGLAPSEKVGRIATIDGIEEVLASGSSFEQGAMIVSRIGESEGRVLIELPRETSSGRWRVWVDQSQIEGLPLGA